MKKHIYFLLIVFVGLGINGKTKGNSREVVVLFSTPPSVQEMTDLLFPKRTKVRSKGVSLNLKKIAAYHPDKEVFFEHNKYEIKRSFFAHLDVIGNSMLTSQAGNSILIIEGHADASGSVDYNQNLSEKRANAVREYLVSRFKIDPVRLRVVGKGESELYDKDNPKAAVNRRVQFRSL